MEAAFSRMVDMSLTASVVILCVMTARLALKRAPKIFSYALWAVVLFRLLCPVSLPSPVSVLEFTQPQVTETAGITTTVSYTPTERHAAQAVQTLEPVQTVTAPETEESLSVASIAAFLWLLGAGVLALAGISSWVALRRDLIGAMRWKGNVYLADHIETPFVMGILRPNIYLPSATSTKERRYIIAHERHHIRRGDHIIKLMAYGALCIHWFNPLVWAAFLLAGKDMEMSCDEAVIQKLGAHIRAEYSSSLLRLATGRRRIAGMPLAFGEGDTKGRVLNMAKWKKPRVWDSAVCVVVCVAVLAACAVNPAGVESPVNFTDLPAGYAYTTEKNGNILITNGSDTVGGVTLYPIPEGVYDPEDEYFTWLLDVGIGDYEDDSLLCAGEITDWRGGWRARFVSEAPEGETPAVERSHVFLVKDNTVYDFWFDEKLVPYEDQEAIVDAAEIVETEQEESLGDMTRTFGPADVGLGDLFYKLPEGYSVETRESEYQSGGDLIQYEQVIMKDGTVIGGVVDYPAPEFDLIIGTADMSQWNYDEWLASLGLWETTAENLASVGGSSLYGDYEISYSSDVPPGEEITVDRFHTFFITEDIVYDVWFDELAANNQDEQAILSTVTIGDGFVTVETEPVQTEPAETQPGMIVYTDTFDSDDGTVTVNINTSFLPEEMEVEGGMPLEDLLACMEEEFRATNVNSYGLDTSVYDGPVTCQVNITEIRIGGPYLLTAEEGVPTLEVLGERIYHFSNGDQLGGEQGTYLLMTMNALDGTLLAGLGRKGK